MDDKKYTLNDVFVGIYSNFPKDVKTYKRNDLKFTEFLFERRHSYSVLGDIAFDNDGIFVESEAVESAFSDLSSTGLLSFDMDFKEGIIKPPMGFRWRGFSKAKFNPKELEELEKLSLEFQEEFC